MARGLYYCDSDDGVAVRDWNVNLNLSIVSKTPPSTRLALHELCKTVMKLTHVKGHIATSLQSVSRITISSIERFRFVQSVST